MYTEMTALLLHLTLRSRQLFFLMLMIHSFGVVSGQVSTPPTERFEESDSTSLEQVDDSSFVWSRYSDDRVMIIEQITYRTAQREQKHGPYFVQYRDGTIISQGRYVLDQKEGEWREHVGEVGFYHAGKREGDWVEYDHQDRVVRRSTYRNGVLNGPSVDYDTSGLILLEEVYRADSLISTTFSGVVVEDLPIFPGCKTTPHMSKREQLQCSNKAFAQYVYGNLRYPDDARKAGKQGQVIVKYTIDKSGLARNLSIIRGADPLLDAEALRVMKAMPRWKPSYRNGMAMNVHMTFPINFKLY